MIMNANRQLIKTIMALLFGLIGSGVLQFGVALYILRATGSSLSFAMTMIISPLVSIIFTPLIGHMVDRYRRKVIVAWAQISSIVALILFAALFDRVESILLLVIPVLISLKIADSFFSAAFMAAVRGIVYDEQINRLQSFISGFQSVAGIISPILGAALYAILRMPVYILLVASFELIALLINLSIDFEFNPKARSASESSSGGVWQTFVQGFGYIKTRPDLIRMALVAMLVNFLLTSQSVGVPQVLINLFRLSDAQYGLVMMAASIGVLAASLVYGLIDYEAKRPIILLYGVAMAMGLLLALKGLPGLLGFTTTAVFYYFFVVMLLSGVVASLVNIPMMSYLQKAIEDDYKGRVFTLFATLATGLTPLSILLFGVLFDHFSADWLFIGTGLSLIGLIGLIWLRTPAAPLEEAHEISGQS